MFKALLALLDRGWNHSFFTTDDFACSNRKDLRMAYVGANPPSFLGMPDAAIGLQVLESKFALHNRGARPGIAAVAWDNDLLRMSEGIVITT